MDQTQKKDLLKYQELLILLFIYIQSVKIFCEYAKKKIVTKYY